VLRSLTDADVPAVVELINEATPQAPVDEAEVRLWLTNPVQDIDVRVVVRKDELVGYADVGMPEETPDRAWLDVRIPERHLTDELVEEALAWGELTARSRGRSVVRAVVEAGSPLAARVERRSYQPIRFSFRMRTDLEETPSPPSWPDGIAVSGLQPGEERLAWEVSQEAFADHWEFTPTSWEEWAHYMLAEDAFDPELWLLARDGDDVAGVCLCRPEAIGRPDVGWIRILGVRPPWRRRGLGRALLLEAFRRFRARGAKAVELGVDGENTTGAVRLYESAGMCVQFRWDIYERRLA
jgi:mycothiol synthase